MKIELLPEQTHSIKQFEEYKKIKTYQNRLSQPIICLDYLIYHEKTNAYELREKFGFLDPAKQISILKTYYAITIYKHSIQIVNRFGRKVRTKEYSLEPFDEE